MFVGVHRIRRHRADRIRRRHLDALIETVDFLLATLRAGYSLQQSLLTLADVAPKSVRPAFDDLRTHIESGASFDTALSNARVRLGEDFAPLIDLTRSAIRLGIPFETLVVQIQSEVRFIHRQRGEAIARQLAVRLTLPLVLCTLPSFVFLIIVPIVMGTIMQLRVNGTTP